jgi:hypothetical protein
LTGEENSGDVSDEEVELCLGDLLAYRNQFNWQDTSNDTNKSLYSRNSKQKQN